MVGALPREEIGGGEDILVGIIFSPKSAVQARDQHLRVSKMIGTSELFSLCVFMSST